MNSRVTITIVVLLSATVAFVLLTPRRGQPMKLERLPEVVAAPAPPPDPLAGRKSLLPQYPGNLRVEDMTPEQGENLAKMFNNRFKPALSRWCNVYKGRLPINLQDVRLDQFKTRLGNDGGDGWRFYSFVTDNGTTVSFGERGDKAGVFQMMAKDAAVALNSLPPPGTTPNTSMPVTKDQVIQMVEEDTGSQFTPSEVLVRPTGLATSIQGGAFVDLGGNSYNHEYYQFTGTNVQFVFGPGGNIINYERDPSR